LILEILMQPFHNYTGVASGKICKQQNTVWNYFLIWFCII
jgi:hypothetical protein